MSEKLRMNAYYYSFEETGCLDIDKILSAVATAGKAHHHTREWNQDDGEPSQIDHIQDAACGAAERIKELETKMQDFVDLLDAHRIITWSADKKYPDLKLKETYLGFKQILKPEPVKNPCPDCKKEWDSVKEWPCPHCGNEIPF